MKKIFLFGVLLLLLSIILLPSFSQAADELCDTSDGGIVPCGQNTSCPCEFGHIFVMLARIYEFIVKMIATPLAIVALTVGGVMILISAGNPNLLGKGKQIIYAAIIGLVLVWGSWLIIDFVLKAIGYTKEWANI